MKIGFELSSLKLRICVRFATTFYVECGCPYNDLVISKDSSDCLGMYESVTQMLEELTWVPLSKRRENARLILFYKIINNLAIVPHSCLEKADGRTPKKT